jgi:hypothetical protein
MNIKWQYSMALIQLFAFGAADKWFLMTDNSERAMPYNLSEYNYSSFLDGDIDTSAHDSIQHCHGIDLPFSVTREKAATRIQGVWKEAITNPSFQLCKKRLLREYHEMCFS